MNRFQYAQNQKHPSLKPKKRLNQEQVRLLETHFNFNNKLDPDRKFQLALELGVPPRQVSIWYQNKRARDKNQSLEMDHKTLQVRLENVLAENASLKLEVERLKAECGKIQEVFSAFGGSSVSCSCDEIGSSKHYSQRKCYYGTHLIGRTGAGSQLVASEGCDLFGL